MVAIDGSGVYTFEKEPYPGCPHKTSKTGKKTYYQNVLEAKIVCSNGFSLSIGTEWLKNEDGQIKQDCEQKALKRLTKKLKTDFPRLSLCILLDGLFASEPVMTQIKSLGWEYVIVWKDGKLKSVQDLLGDIRLAGGVKHIYKEQIHTNKSKTDHRYEYSSQALKYKNHEFYYIKYAYEYTHLENDGAYEKKQFVYISSIPANKDNIFELTQGGRLRWKIENEGFNTQKNQGMNLHHKYVRKNFTGIRNFYMCMQIAHIFEQLFVLCKNKIMDGWKTIKGMWLHIWAYMLMAFYKPPNKTKKLNLNFRY